MSDSLRPHGLQHARLPCPSPTPGACSNSCPWSRRWHPTILFSVFSLLLLSSIFPSIRVFSKEPVLRIGWPKYWSFSFSISPAKEYSGLISFRIDWFDQDDRYVVFCGLWRKEIIFNFYVSMRAICVAFLFFLSLSVSVEENFSSDRLKTLDYILVTVITAYWWHSLAE